MNIHSCHMVFAVSLYHAQELPTVSFIKRGMVGNQINRSDFIIAKTDKVCIKFSFLTETLTLPRYDGGRKSERVMKNELREKGCGVNRAADGRSRHAVLRCLAGRGGDSAEQSNQIMSGVCGHWIKSFQAFHRPCPASGAGSRRGRRC